jgi:hypothetical protein
MAHYAFLDENNIVTEVIVGRNEDEIVDGVSDWEAHYGQIRGQKCKRTSLHGNIRRTFARVGSRYDETADAFILPSPFPSWELNAELDWVSPISYPEDDNNLYEWSEIDRAWVVSHNWDQEKSEWKPVQ